MEPLKIDQLGIENNSGNIRIKGQFLNVINSGSSNFTVKEVRSDLKVRKGLLTVVKSFLSLTAALLARFFCAETPRRSWPLHSSHQIERTLRSERPGLAAADLVPRRIYC
jgi:Haemolymph juvenile hormone binding protein (JHBP)